MRADCQKQLGEMLHEREQATRAKDLAEDLVHKFEVDKDKLEIQFRRSEETNNELQQKIDTDSKHIKQMIMSAKEKENKFS